MGDEYRVDQEMCMSKIRMELKKIKEIEEDEGIKYNDLTDGRKLELEIEESKNKQLLSDDKKSLDMTKKTVTSSKANSKSHVPRELSPVKEAQINIARKKLSTQV